ncbi:MAG: efflux RND transporter periplasmic adaptor subunit [Gammaproteobacteria bacterium]|nr:efflux RND transporter periplasmic adaptor subunit [Gammaproteobacteria bacterium]
MRQNLITAFVIALVLSLWLLSGIIFGDDADTSHATLAEQNARHKSENGGSAVRVRARIIEAQPRTRYLVMRGKTQSKHSVEVKAETDGRVVDRPVERGARVKKGDLLCQLKINEKELLVEEMRTALEQAKIEYKGSLRLQKQGLQSETSIAQAAARLAAAKTNLRRAQLLLGATRIVAPFDGAVEQLHMDVGDYATIGRSCATVINLDPMLVTADVTESEVEKLQLHNTVTGTTSAGHKFDGKITFIGQQSDRLTRTYPIEITAANPGYSLRSGLTATVRVATEEVLAQRVSPALFTLSDSGELGIRIIDSNNKVEFVAVSVIEDTPSGVWVAGLPERARIITVGQEFVLAGQAVEPDYPAADLSTAGIEAAGSMPAHSTSIKQKLKQPQLEQQQLEQK